MQVSQLILWAAQLVKNLPAMQETGVRFLGQKDPLEKEMATHSSILAWWIPRTEEPWQATVHGVTRVRHDLVTKPPSPLSNKFLDGHPRDWAYSGQTMAEWGPSQG